MTVVIALLFGVVQGIAEFLPISASGHLAVLLKLFQVPLTEGNAHLLHSMLNFGSLFALLLAYRRDWRMILRESTAFFRKRGRRNGKTEDGRFSPNVRTGFLLLTASLPLIPFAVFYRLFMDLSQNLAFVGFAMFMTGGVIYFSTRLPEGKKGTKTMTVADAFRIGLAQAVTVVPGFSRVGVAMSLGVCRGLQREQAVRFALLLSVPALFGAGVYRLILALIAGADGYVFLLSLISFAVSAFLGVFVISLLQRLAARNQFGKISYYCWAAGLLSVIISFF